MLLYLFALSATYKIINYDILCSKVLKQLHASINERLKNNL